MDTHVRISSMKSMMYYNPVLRVSIGLAGVSLVSGIVVHFAAVNFFTVFSVAGSLLSLVFLLIALIPAINNPQLLKNDEEFKLRFIASAASFLILAIIVSAIIAHRTIL